MNSDILSSILKFLPLSDLLVCSGVSKFWFESAEHEIFCRTKLKARALKQKHLQHNKSVLKKILVENKKKMSVRGFLNKIKLSGMLALQESDSMMVADDLNSFPSLILSARWYRIPVNHKIINMKSAHWCFATPIFISKNHPNWCRDGSVFFSRHFLLTDNTDALEPVVKSKMISLYNIGEAIIAVWNDSSDIAFVVRTIPLSMPLLDRAFDLSCKARPMKLENFGVTMILVVRNFKKVYVEEIFPNLFYAKDDKLLQGIDRTMLSGISLNPDFGVLWKTENFKGKIPGCAIMDITLKHNTMYQPDNLWDVSKYRLSQLCKLEPADNGCLEFGAGNCFCFGAHNALLDVKLLLYKDEADGMFKANDIEVRLMG